MAPTTDRQNRGAIALGPMRRPSVLLIYVVAHLLSCQLVGGAEAGLPVAGAELSKLLADLGSSDAETRTSAAQELGKMRPKAAVTPLIRTLSDKDPYVRGWSAWALGEIGNSRAVGPLIGALESDVARGKVDPTARQTKSIPEIVAALRKLTGEDFGYDPRRWRDWHSKKENLKTDTTGNK